jgi:hypothetical protein
MLNQDRAIAHRELRFTTDLKKEFHNLSWKNKELKPLRQAYTDKKLVAKEWQTCLLHASWTSKFFMIIDVWALGTGKSLSLVVSLAYYKETFPNILLVMPNPLLMAIALTQLTDFNVNLDGIEVKTIAEIIDTPAEELGKYKDYVVLADEVHLLLDWIITNKNRLIVPNSDAKQPPKFLFKKIIGMTATMEDSHRAKLKGHSDLNHWTIDATAMASYDGIKTVTPIYIPRQAGVIDRKKATESALNWVK